MEIDRLPPLDLVVLSHMHGDHWDRVARRGLDKALPIMTTVQAARRLWAQGFGEAVGLDTWEDRSIERGGHTLRITSLPGRHAPRRARALLPPVMGSMLEFGRDGGHTDLRLCISGDTLMDGCLAEIPERFPDIDLGIVHLGGTKLLGLLMVTMDGRQGAEWISSSGPGARCRCTTTTTRRSPRRWGTSGAKSSARPVRPRALHRSRRDAPAARTARGRRFPVAGW
ncbi:MBL fold metallo-hydrolase [Streptosporangium lutulentum]